MLLQAKPLGDPNKMLRIFYNGLAPEGAKVGKWLKLFDHLQVIFGHGR